MGFFSGFFRGIGNCFRGFGLLFSKELWPFMVIPLVLWILLYLATVYGFSSLATYISEGLQSLLNVDSIPDSGSWLSWLKPLLKGVGFLIEWLLRFIFWFISGTLVKYVLLMILSPVFAMLSERTEEKINGNKFPFSFSQLLKDVVRGIAMTLRNMFMQLIIVVPCMIISFFFPPLLLVTAPFTMFVGWYFIGFSLMDYSCERHKYNVGQSVEFMRKNKGYVCGVGLVYSFFLSIPFLDAIGMMFGPAVSVIGGTIGFLELTSPGKSGQAAAEKT
jgi:CysZ protein